RLLVRDMSPAPSEAYRERLPYHLEITPAFFNSVVDRSLTSKLTPVVVHSHQGTAAAQYSRSDDFGEARLLPVLQQLVPSRTPGSLLLTSGDVIGRTYANGGFQPMEGVEVKGIESRFFRRERPSQQRRSGIEEFDRQIRAIGDKSQ